MAALALFSFSTPGVPQADSDARALVGMLTTGARSADLPLDPGIAMLGLDGKVLRLRAE